MDDDAFANVAAIVLGGSPCNLVTMPYYDRLTQHIRKHDEPLNAAMAAVFEGLQKYRTPQQFAHAVGCVPFEKQPDSHMKAALDGDCAICLRPLNGSQRVLRLRAESDDPAQCGHLFHANCLANWELRLDPGAPKQCPVCRARLGIALNCWADLERKLPRF